MSTENTILEMKAEDAWTNPPDLLNRKGYATFLTQYLASQTKPFVLNLNASWGMGKTYFLQHWRASIQNTHPTVYINAWESDFSDDPLLAVISDIQQQLSPFLSDEKKTVKGFANALRAGSRFLRRVAPVISKGVAQKVLGTETTADVLALMSENNWAEVAESSMAILLEDHNDKQQCMTDFKHGLEDMISSTTSRTRTFPLFVFIDELDRCRPTYAIELLETVKHLFSVNGAVFIVATDSAQLQHAISAVYGERFDGAEYLRRFFDQEYALPTPDYNAYCYALAAEIEEDLVKNLTYENFLPWTIIDSTPAQRTWNDTQSAGCFLAYFCNHFCLSLRTASQVAHRLDAILRNSTDTFFAPALILLLALHAKNRTAFQELKGLSTRKGEQDETLVHEMLQPLIPMGGSIVAWRQRSRGQTIMENYTASRIATELFVTLIEINSFTPLKLFQSIEIEDQTLRGFLIKSIFNTSTDRRTSISEYFNIVELAGRFS